MRLLLLCIAIELTMFQTIQSACVTMYCPAVPNNSSSPKIDCRQCKRCGDQGLRFCAARSSTNCTCVKNPADDCKITKGNSTELQKITFCHVIGSLQLPPPTVRPSGHHALSITVPRFFADEEEFTQYSLANLNLYIHFNKASNSTCESLAHILVLKNSEKECVYRIGLSMPGVDHKTDDAYYYDDRTDLETELATELLHDADNVDVWIEVTTTSTVHLDGRTIRFNNAIRSPKVIHTMRTPHPQHAGEQPMVAADQPVPAENDDVFEGSEIHIPRNQ